MQNQIIKGAVTGLTGAIFIDFREWAANVDKSTGHLPSFAIKEAWPRWLIGLVMGGLAGAGLQ